MKWAAGSVGNGKGAEWSSNRAAHVSQEATGNVCFYFLKKETGTTQWEEIQLERNQSHWELTIRSVPPPRHDGLSAGIQLGLPERAPAHSGTLGRTPTGQTEAVRAPKVGESSWVTLSRPWHHCFSRHLRVFPPSFYEIWPVRQVSYSASWSEWQVDYEDDDTPEVFALDCFYGKIRLRLNLFIIQCFRVIYWIIYEEK